MDVGFWDLLCLTGVWLGGTLPAAAVCVFGVWVIDEDFFPIHDIAQGTKDYDPADGGEISVPGVWVPGG